MSRMTWSAVVALILVGCGASSGDLPSRAAFEMNCPEDKLTWTKFGDDTVGVTGCGQKHVYVQDCHGVGGYRECTWVLNSTTK